MNIRKIYSVTVKRTFLFPVLFVLFSVCAVHAELIAKVAKVDHVGSKAVLNLKLKNTYEKGIEGARAVVFLLDEHGKMVVQSTRWVIGGTKDKPALAPGAETTFFFVVSTDKPFKETKLTFTRIVLEGGKVVNQAGVFQPPKPPDKPN